MGKAASRVHDWIRVQQTVRAFHDLRPDQRRGHVAGDVAELSHLVSTQRQAHPV